MRAQRWRLQYPLSLLLALEQWGAKPALGLFAQGTCGTSGELSRSVWIAPFVCAPVRDGAGYSWTMENSSIASKSMVRPWVGLVLLLVLYALASPLQAQDTSRDSEIAQCLPGEIATWGDGRDRPAVASPMIFVYDHAGAPAWFDEGQVLLALQRAAAGWSKCGVPSRVEQQFSTTGTEAHSVAVRWSDVDSVGNFGLAFFSRRSLVLGPAAFHLLRSRNPAYDARETLQMVVSHEMGHLFGLMAHSRRCVDVTSNYDNGNGETCFARDRSQLRRFVEYRSSLPTACDIQRCKIANAMDETRP